jgi:hypothetical protein
VPKAPRIPEDELRKLHSAGVAKHDIMKHYGINCAAVIQRQERDLGLPPRKRGPKDQKTPSVKKVLGVSSNIGSYPPTPKEVRIKIVSEMRPNKTYSCKDLAESTGIGDLKIRANIPVLIRLNLLLVEDSPPHRRGRTYRLNVRKNNARNHKD